MFAHVVTSNVKYTLTKDLFFGTYLQNIIHRRLEHRALYISPKHLEYMNIIYIYTLMECRIPLQKQRFRENKFPYEWHPRCIGLIPGRS